MDDNDKDNGNYEMIIWMTMMKISAITYIHNHRWHTVQIVREGRIVEAKVEHIQYSSKSYICKQLVVLLHDATNRMPSKDHTFYLSQTPQTCLCKNFLSGVNFSRMSEKNAFI